MPDRSDRDTFEMSTQDEMAATDNWDASQYPRTKPNTRYYGNNGELLTPEHHSKWMGPLDMVGGPHQYVDDEYLYRSTLHNTRDYNDPTDLNSELYPIIRPSNELDQVGKNYQSDVTDNLIAYQMNTGDVHQSNNFSPVFSGSTTHVNPLEDPVKQKIIDYGLEYYEKNERVPRDSSNGLRKGSSPSPISADHPFTRMNDELHPNLAQQAILTTYNRVKLPIADNEWRKGFRHLFFTRPECYICCTDDNGTALSEQAMYDEDFSSANLRMPHILRLLSPVYVTGSVGSCFGGYGSGRTNWNYLLSNRVQGLSTTATQMTTLDNIGKSIEGFTVTPALHVESRQGATLDLSFQDTKNLEVYECLRLWMLYMYKRRKGIFAPSYNGYQFQNGFKLPISNEDGAVSKIAGPTSPYWCIHPYDRALDYCASLFDIITNESGTKILYWCKYYGVYPTSVTPALTNDKNAAITEMNIQTTFKYHYRLENVNKTLLEFNYNAGLTDGIGNYLGDEIQTSLPFLLRDNYANPVLPQYIGAAGMFTGSPYIVLGDVQQDPTNNSNMIRVPFLRFAKIQQEASVPDADNLLNLGLVNNKAEDMSPLAVMTT